MKKSVLIALSVVAAVVVATGLGVLIWWLVADHDSNENETNRFETIPLQEDSFQDVEFRAAFTRIPKGGDVFWCFFPTTASDQTSRPIILWLDGVVGLPPSLLANFGMFGPFDFNLQKRNDSWIDEYNLLFVDAPLGSGFSTIPNESVILGSLEDNVSHLLLVLESFYGRHKDFANSPLYIFGQGYGAQLALSLALGLTENEYISPNLQGVVLGNGIISPAVALTKLGFYLEELGYIESRGRAVVENLSSETYNYVSNGQFGQAFDNFISLEKFVNENAGAVAVNLEHMVDKLTRGDNTSKDFGQIKYLQNVYGFDLDFNKFMDETVAPILGIKDPKYNSHNEDIIKASRDYFMTPATSKVEEILNKTNVNVAIYNGNLDAVSNTPGQLEWVNNLRWSNQSQFLNSSRQTLVVNRLVEGYFRETDRLQFYWINVAGLSAPLENPAAVRRVIQKITSR